MLLYHGTNNKFSEFSYDCIGENGTERGVGFYFTDSKDIARMYTENNGYIMSADIYYQKPLSSSEITLSYNQIERLLLKIQEKTDILNDIQDVGYYGFDYVLNYAVKMFLQGSSNDVDIISDIIFVSRDAKLVLTTLYNTTGYDSIVNIEDDYIIVIALVNDIIAINDFEQV